MSPPDFHLNNSIIHLRQLPLPYVVDLTQLQDVALLWGGGEKRDRDTMRGALRRRLAAMAPFPMCVLQGKRKSLLCKGGRRGRRRRRRRRPSRSAPLFILASPSSLVVMDNSCGAERKHSRSYSPPLQSPPRGRFCRTTVRSRRGRRKQHQHKFPPRT